MSAFLIHPLRILIGILGLGLLLAFYESAINQSGIQLPAPPGKRPHRQPVRNEFT